MGKESQRVLEQFASIGVRLRAAREARGLTQSDISATTRISLPFVQKIEAGDFEGLPALPFIRGFVRNYATLVGLKPDDLLADFNRALGQEENGGNERLTPPSEVMPPVVNLPGPKAWILTAIGGLVVWGVVSLFTSGNGGETTSPAPTDNKPAQPPAATPDTTTPQPPASAPAAAPQSPAPSTPAPPAADDTLVPTKGLRLTLKAIAPTWVRVNVDRTTAVEIFLVAGETHQWDAKDSFTLTVGRAGGVTAFLNQYQLRLASDPNTLVDKLMLNHKTLENLDR